MIKNLLSSKALDRVLEFVFAVKHLENEAVHTVYCLVAERNPTQTFAISEDVPVDAKDDDCHFLISQTILQVEHQFYVVNT